MSSDPIFYYIIYGYYCPQIPSSFSNYVQDLSEYRHPPAKIAGVLERAFSMLRPSCPENLAIYSEIESYIAVVKSQILALVPTTSGNAALAM